MSAWGSVDQGMMPVWDELRLILAENCHPQKKDRALHLVEMLLQEERRRAASGELAAGGHEGSFAMRPNGEITGPGHSSAYGDDALGANGVLWGPAMGVGAAWGKGVGVADIPIGGGIGPWGGDGLGASGAGWGFSGTRVASSGNEGLGGNGGLGVGIDDDAAVSAALSGLALDGPSGQPLGAWVPNPVASFDLDPAPVQDSRLGSFFLPPAVGPLGAPGPATPGQSQPQAAAPSQAPAAAATVPAPAPAVTVAAPPQLQQAGAPEPTTPPAVAKFSSVVGGTASGRPQVSAAAAAVAKAAVDDSKPKGGSSAQHRAAPRRPLSPPPKVEAKRTEIKRIDAANAGAGKGGTTSKVKLRGLPYGATTMDVVNFFKGFGVTESNVQFGVNSDGRPSGEAWISFPRLEDARRAVREKDRHHMGDRYVELFLLNEGGGVASRGYK